MDRIPARGTTARHRGRVAFGTWLALAAMSLATPAHAASCDSAAHIAADLWNEYGKDAMQLGCTVAGAATTVATSGASGDPAATSDACLDNATKREQMVRRMIATWNRLASNRWATLGPRQLLLDVDHEGTVVGPGTRLFVTPAPLHAEAIDLAFRKEDFRGAVEVTVCSYAAGGHKARRMNFTVAPGDGNIGKRWLKRIEGVKGQLLSVHIVGKSVARKLRYVLDVDSADGSDTGAGAQVATAPSSPPPADEAPSSQPAGSAAPTMATCSAVATDPRDLQRGTGGLRPRVPAAAMPVAARPASLPVLDRLRAPSPRSVAAFAPDGGWLVARGIRSFARGIPDEAVRKLGEFSSLGKPIDAVAFTPDGGWTIVAGDRSWTRNVGGRYHDAVTALLADGHRVRSVAFNPAAWSTRRGFVLAYDDGFVAEHIPKELCGRLKAFTRSDGALDVVAFTQDGGWTVVAGNRSWTRNVGGPEPDYHGAVISTLGDGGRVHAVAFDAGRHATPGGWLLLTDRGFRGHGVPDTMAFKLVRMFGLRKQPGR
ncbi:MAG TPA: hypothetical protein VFM73_08425 [Xanthomonadaceae bacterium]|nr:hypothetical protein [Xanthomonadaceae bacterium]